MANSVAPDSWEQQADLDAGLDPKSVESKFSTLNVNAAEFVPSFCINTPSAPQQSQPVPKATITPSVLQLNENEQQQKQSQQLTNQEVSTMTTTTKTATTTPESGSPDLSPLSQDKSETMPPETHHG